MTSRAVNEADEILKEVGKRASTMCHKNRQAAIQYVVKLRDSLKEYSKVGTEKVDTVIKGSINNITEDLHSLKTTIKNVSNRLVDIAQSEIDEIASTVERKDEQNLTKELEDAILRAVDEVEAMWNGLDQISVLYTSYWSDLIEKRVQNMTEKVSHLIHEQGKFFNGPTEEHVRMCQNISLANMEASTTIQNVVLLMSGLYNTTRMVSNLQSVYLNADQHASNVIDESKSLLSKYQKTTKKTFDILMADHFCFLGSAIRISSVSMSAYLKRYILRLWKVSLGNAITIFNSAISDHLVITEDYHGRLVNDVKDSLKKLGNKVRKKATLLEENERNLFTGRANFDELNDFTNNRFKNLTEVINSQFDSSLASMGEGLKFHIEFMINQKLPYLPTLTIQNYLPTDVCPLSMDFAKYIEEWVNGTDSGSDPRIDHKGINPDW